MEVQLIAGHFGDTAKEGISMEEIGSVHPGEILAMMDRIASSTEDNDEVKLAVERIRSLKLGGVTPSMVLQHFVVADRVISPEDDQPRIEELTSKIAALVVENAQLEAEVAALHQQLEHADKSIAPVDGFYTMGHFLMVLTAKLRRSYAWRTDYIRASQQTPGCNPVANETIQRWQNGNRVPDWAVHQIDKLTFQRRTGASAPTWSDADESFLVEQYQADPSQRNTILAERCADHFGRPINENSIKGAIDRLRKQGRLPLKKPRP